MSVSLVQLKGGALCCAIVLVVVVFERDMEFDGLPVLDCVLVISCVQAYSALLC